MAQPASLKEVMQYFGETSSSQFSKEWKELTPEEKEWFKVAVGEVIHPSEED